MSRLNSFLDGYKVVDLSRHLPGPMLTLLMADMGAEVLKIEPPYGDELRSIGPRPEGRGTSLWFEAVNAGKQGLKLDMKSAQDLSTFHQLLMDCDVLVESFRPGTLDKLGLGIEQLRETYPRLVICSLNGYGENSPLRDASGHDINYLAANGVLSGTGTADQAVAPWPPIADCSAGLFGLSGVLGALLERERSGAGCHVEVALADAPMPLACFSLADLALGDAAPGRAEALLNGGSAQYRTYQTSDGKLISLGALEPKFWHNFCHAAGHPEWIERSADPLPQEDLQQELCGFFAGQSLAQSNALFNDADCCYSEVLPLKTAVDGEHIASRRLVTANEDGSYTALFPAYVDRQPPAQRNPFTMGDEK